MGRTVNWRRQFRVLRRGLLPIVAWFSPYTWSGESALWRGIIVLCITVEIVGIQTPPESKGPGLLAIQQLAIGTLLWVGFVSSAARAESAAFILSERDFRNMDSFITKLRYGSDPASRYLSEKLSTKVRHLIATCEKTGILHRRILQAAVVADLKRILRRDCLYEREEFRGAIVSGELRELLASTQKQVFPVALNRFVLEEVFPEIRPAEIIWVETEPEELDRVRQSADEPEGAKDSRYVELLHHAAKMRRWSGRQRLGLTIMGLGVLGPILVSSGFPRNLRGSLAWFLLPIALIGPTLYLRELLHWVASSLLGPSRKEH